MVKARMAAFVLALFLLAAGVSTAGAASTPQAVERQAAPAAERSAVPQQPAGSYAAREAESRDLLDFAGGRQVVFVAPYDVFLLVVLVTVIVVLIIVL